MYTMDKDCENSELIDEGPPSKISRTDIFTERWFWVTIPSEKVYYVNNIIYVIIWRVL